MPSGKTHDKINMLFLYAFLIGMTFIGFFSLKFALFFSCGYLFGTFWLGPDLDTRSKVFKRWGVFKFVWVPYQKIYSHRSIFTHGIIIGDVIRLFYLGMWLTLFFIFPSYVVDQYLKEWVNGWVTNFHDLWIWTFSVLILLFLYGSVMSFSFSKSFKQSYLKNKTGFWTSITLLLSISLNVTDKLSVFKIFIEYCHKEPYALWFVPIGIILASMIHIMSDIFTSSIKGLLK